MATSDQNVSHGRHGSSYRITPLAELPVGIRRRHPSLGCGSLDVGELIETLGFQYQALWFGSSIAMTVVLPLPVAILEGSA